MQHIDEQIPLWLKQSSIFSVVVVNLQGKYAYVNDIFKKRFATLNMDFIGQPFNITIHEDDFEQCNQAVTQCFLYPTQPVKVKMRKPIHISTDFIWTEWEFSVFYDQNKIPNGIICIGYDITNELEVTQKLDSSENILSAILNSSNDPKVLISNQTYQILNFNRAATENYRKLFDKEMRIGQDFREFIAEEWKSFFYDNFEKASKGETSKTDVEIRFNAETNTTTWREFTFYPVYNKENQIFGISLINADIDKRKNAEIKVKRQNELLRNIAWQQSHELRSPLASILGLIDLLKIEKNFLTFADIIPLLDEASKNLDFVVSKIVANANIDVNYEN